MENIVADKNLDDAVPFWKRDFGLENAIPLEAAKIATYLCMLNREVPLLLSHTAQGKSDMVKQLAHAMDLRVVWINMIGLEPTDLTGLPFPQEDEATFKYLSDARIPTGDNDERVLIFIDEANRCEPSTVNALFNFINRQMGPHTLGPNCYIVMAANPAGSTYGVAGQMTSDPALLRRVVVIPVKRSDGEFLNYIRDTDAAFKMDMPKFGAKGVEHLGRHKVWHPNVVNFLTSHPDCIESSEMMESGQVFATAAGWERISKLEYALERLQITRANMTMSVVLPAIYAGTLGPQIGERYRSFVDNPALDISAKEILFKLKDKGRAYNTIKELSEQGRDSQVIEKLEGVAAFIAFETPKIEDIVDSIALLYTIIHSHTYSAFSESLNKHARGNPNLPASYLMNMQSQVARHPVAKKALQAYILESDQLDIDEVAAT